jgi:hypothetical protein
MIFSWDFVCTKRVKIRARMAEMPNYDSVHFAIKPVAAKKCREAVFIRNRCLKPANCANVPLVAAEMAENNQI